MNCKEDSVLVLFFNDPDVKSVFLDSMNKIEGIQARCVFKSVNKFKAFLRKIHMKSMIPGIGVWFLDWHGLIKKDKRIVCIASEYSPIILKWIKKKEQNVELINYYWDRIDIAHYPVRKSNIYDNWSFCKYDCERYQMKYNPQFYLHTLVLLNREIIYDVSFIGSDRGGQWVERRKFVVEYYKLFKGMGLSLFFHFVSKADIVPKEIKKRNWLTEEEFNLVISKSRALLEIVQPGKEWITQRPLVALANGKKVITNNKYIVSEKFYSKENIFILGVDDERKLPLFVRSDFEPIEKDVLSFYEVEAWSKRFFC